MGKPFVLSLSERGYIDATDQMLAKLLSYYILTDAGQTLVFQDNLINLPETYYRHINDPRGMAVAVKEDVTKLLERYFDNVEVVTDVEDKGNTAVAIMIYAHVLDELGVKVSLGKVLEMDNEGLRKTVDVSNIGDGRGLLR